MSAAIAPNHPDLFTSWKEIAAYCGKGVRTVQRWETQFGLPVQRPDSRSKGIVRASQEELDAWMKNRWTLRNAASTLPTIGENVMMAQELRKEHRRAVEALCATIRKLSDNMHFDASA